ncbi:MAG: pentapeptide repeat-containing protein [Betaproteobacteria bacterium]
MHQTIQDCGSRAPSGRADLRRSDLERSDLERSRLRRSCLRRSCLRRPCSRCTRHTPMQCLTRRGPQRAPTTKGVSA